MKRTKGQGLGLAGTLVLAALAVAPLASAQHIKPLPHWIGAPNAASPFTQSSASRQATRVLWTALTNQPTFLVNGSNNPVLLTDGSVLVQDAGSPDWWKLTPDQSGSYVNGTWSQIASTDPGYAPLYHSTAVLPDGRMIIEGGEYNNFVAVWTDQGAIYDPVANTWTPITAPAWFGGLIGDAQSVVLANGTYMQSTCCSTLAALLDPQSLTWTPTGTGKADVYDEEGWTLLPNKKVLTVDAYVFAYDPAGMNSEIYNPKTGAWTGAGSTRVQLWDSAAACGGYLPSSEEVGPGVLRPDGTVFYTGANQCAAAHTAIYNSHSGTWAAGPDFPDGLGIGDGPAALEPNGKVLMMASPGVFNFPSVFLEWNGKALTEVAGPPNAASDSSYYGNMLVLPTGQILLTDFSNDIEIYTPRRAEESENGPRVTSVPTQLSAGSSYQISGYGFNGVSQGAAYGDDAQAATNFPLVRITNVASGHVFYARTHDHSSMAVASENRVSTHFDVSAAQESGPSLLEVVVNGNASPKVAVTVQ